MDLFEKKKYCLLLSGFTVDKMEKMHRWNELGTFIMKPQWFHSAMSIYILIKYPQFRTKTSFIQSILQENKTDEVFQMAIDVITSDENGMASIDGLNRMFDTHDIIIIDDHNKKALYGSHD